MDIHIPLTLAAATTVRRRELSSKNPARAPTTYADVQAKAIGSTTTAATAAAMKKNIDTAALAGRLRRGGRGSVNDPD